LEGSKEGGREGEEKREEDGRQENDTCINLSSD
jgi:hypothetical protein